MKISINKDCTARDGRHNKKSKKKYKTEFIHNGSHSTKGKSKEHNIGGLLKLHSLL